MALPNNKIRIKRRANNVASLIYSVYNPRASQAKVRRVGKRTANSIIYAPKKGKWLVKANPVAWALQGVSGVYTSAVDAKYLLTKKGRSLSRGQKKKYVKDMKKNFFAPEVGSSYMYHPIAKKILITSKTASTPALAHEITHKLRGFKSTNTYDANSVDRYFVLMDKLSKKKFSKKELNELVSRTNKRSFLEKDVSTINSMYKKKFSNKIIGHLKSMGLIEEHSRFLREPRSLEGGLSGGRIAFMADLAFKKPFMGLVILKSLSEGKKVEKVFLDAQKGKFDAELKRIHELNPTMSRHYSRVLKNTFK